MSTVLSELIALYFMHNHFLFLTVSISFKIYFLFNFVFIVVIVFFIIICNVYFASFYVKHFELHCVLMCYINKLALPM